LMNDDRYRRVLADHRGTPDSEEAMTQMQEALEARIRALDESFVAMLIELRRLRDETTAKDALIMKQNVLLAAYDDLRAEMTAMLTRQNALNEKVDEVCAAATTPDRREWTVADYEGDLRDRGIA
jgi:hypothetical protein